MQQQTGNKLLWIRTLMIISEVLLIVFIANWLQSQYSGQKKQLQKDLEAALNSVQEKISDSVIKAEIINPLIEKKEIDINAYNKVKADTLRQASIASNPKYSIYKLNLGNLLKSKGFNHPSNISVSINPADNKGQFIYIPGGTAEKDELIKHIVSKALKQLMRSDTNGHDDILMPDTAVLTKAFSDKLNANGWAGFTTSWFHTDTSGLINIKNVFFSKHYNVGIGNYSNYLFKKILAQVLFSLLLLCITMSAFILTYRTLREQMKLAVLKNDLVSNISHELKTPISTIRVALEALDKFNMIQDPAIARDYVKMASSEIARLDLLSNQVLNTALLEAGKMQLQKEACDVKILIAELLRVMSSQFQQNNAIVQLKSTGANFVAAIDKLHFQGVIINLLENSMKYNKGIPLINIGLGETENYLVISVSDNGPGIPKEYLKRIFEKFFRVPDGERHNVKGYGLGLSYAKQVVDLHRGQIKADNNEKEGCTITIVIPKSKA